MKQAALAALVLLTALLPARGVAAAQLASTLYVLGVPVADVFLTLEMGPSSYHATLRYQTTGIARLLMSDSLEQQAHGVFDGPRPVPVKYTSHARLHGQERHVTMIYNGHTPSISAILPSNTLEREDVPAVLRTRTVDPLSTIVTMLRQAALTGRCDGTARDFDGRRLELFTMWTAGEENLPPTARSVFAGSALRCEFSSQIQAGFRLGEKREDDTHPRRGTIWLGKVLPNAPRLPVHATVETRWLGHATMYLTEASP